MVGKSIHWSNSFTMTEVHHSDSYIIILLHKKEDQRKKKYCYNSFYLIGRQFPFIMKPLDNYKQQEHTGLINECSIMLHLYAFNQLSEKTKYYNAFIVCFIYTLTILFYSAKQKTMFPFFLFPST